MEFKNIAYLKSTRFLIHGAKRESVEIVSTRNAIAVCIAPSRRLYAASSRCR